MLRAVPDTKLIKRRQGLVCRGLGPHTGILSEISGDRLGWLGRDSRLRLQNSFQHGSDVYAFKEWVCVTLQPGKVIDALYILPKTTQYASGYLICPFLVKRQEMVRAKNVKVTSLSFAQRM